MGGFVVDVRDMHNTAPRLTLTPAGLLALAHQGRYIRLPDETINDKSKSDIFGKILVCIQAVWILVQCVTRAIKDLPLTLLELHTLIQACFALIMYLFWIPVRPVPPTTYLTGYCLANRAGVETAERSGPHDSNFAQSARATSVDADQQRLCRR